MLTYFLFNKWYDENFNQVAVICPNETEARKILAERFYDAKDYELVYSKNANGMVVIF